MRRVRREIEGPIGGTDYYGSVELYAGGGGGAGSGEGLGTPSGVRHALLLRYMINPSDGAWGGGGTLVWPLLDVIIELVSYASLSRQGTGRGTVGGGGISESSPWCLCVVNVVGVEGDEELTELAFHADWTTFKYGVQALLLLLLLLHAFWGRGNMLHKTRNPCLLACLLVTAGRRSWELRSKTFYFSQVQWFLFCFLFLSRVVHMCHELVRLNCCCCRSSFS